MTIKYKYIYRKTLYFFLNHTLTKKIDDLFVLTVRSYSNNEMKFLKEKRDKKEKKSFLILN